MNHSILADSGYWMALYDSRDQYHLQASQISEYLEGSKILIPWPSLYETLNTRFSKRKDRMAQYEAMLAKEDSVLLDDSEYREKAFNDFFAFAKREGPVYSLVDLVIREMLKNENQRIDYLSTFNRRDFEDLCARRRIEILE